MNEVVNGSGVIAKALADFIALDERHDERVAQATQAVVKALAKEHLYIFKSKGVEL